jgi:ureidoglycolate lyase
VGQAGVSARLRIEPLTPDAFAPFGDVIAPEAAQRVFPINAGNTQRFHDLAQVECLGDGGRVGISLFRGQPRELPFAVTMLERHPLGSQAFVPLSKTPYLVVVAKSPEATPRAFLARDGQGVNYHRGTWHHPLLALETVSDFLVVDRIGPGDNCEEAMLAQAWLLDAGAA